MDQREAQAELLRRHEARVQRVAVPFGDGEVAYDTGPVRVEQGLNRVTPGRDEDTGGELVLTDRRLILRDDFGVADIPYSQVRTCTAKALGRFGAKKMMANVTIALHTGDLIVLQVGRTFSETGYPSQCTVCRGSERGLSVPGPRQG